MVFVMEFGSMLSYRGVQFSRATQRSIQPMQAGFRGQRFTYQSEPLATYAEVDFQFRGLPTRGIGGSLAVKPGVLSEAKALASVHKANIQRRLEQRLQAARQRGDERLVMMLEDERQQIA